MCVCVCVCVCARVWRGQGTERPCSARQVHACPSPQPASCPRRQEFATANAPELGMQTVPSLNITYTEVRAAAWGVLCAVAGGGGAFFQRLGRRQASRPHLKTPLLALRRRGAT